MPLYEFHFFDRLNVCILIREYSADDDLAALDEAHALSNSHAIEVWQQGRRVARVNRSNAPLRTADRESL